MCRALLASPVRRSEPSPGRNGLFAPPARAEEHANDQQRRSAADLLARAFGEGLLDVVDLEQRLAAVWAAQTVGDLRAATGALPAAWLGEVERDSALARERAEHAARRRGEIRAYVGVMALLVLVWLATAVSAGAWHPWPLWPALGWGIPLLLAGRPVDGRRPPARLP